MKIAVIGSGIAGLSAAYWLSQEADVHVVLLERESRLGMDAHRLDLASGGQSIRVDVPSRMFNEAQWPQLSQLYDHLGVQYQPVDASQSFSRLSNRSRVSTYLRFDMALRPEMALRSVLGGEQRKLLRQAKRLSESGRVDLANGISESMTFAEYLSRNKYSHGFINEFLYPTLSSTVCSCSYQALSRYPAVVMLSALRRMTDDRDLMRTSLGTCDVVSRLKHPRTEFRLGASVDSVKDLDDCVELRIGDGVERFDQVIMATQANTASTLLDGQSDSEHRMLSSFRYEHVEVVVHTDDHLMPDRRRDWSTFNMVVADTTATSAMCSVWLNRFYGNWSTSNDYFQTISPIVDPDPEMVHRRVKLQRAVVDQQSINGLHALDGLHRETGRRIWYCGSWAARGIPLLETAVTSARTAVDCALQRTPAVP